MLVSPEAALLISRASAAVGWRAWEFAAALVLFDLYPSSLTLVAAFGLADTLVQAATGPALGRYVDRTERYRSAITMYAIQHTLVAVSCLAAAGAFLFPPDSAGRLGLAATVVVAGVLAGAGATGSTLSVEQVWVVALCGSEGAALTSLNSKMRAVDLAALLLAPLAAAAVLQYAGSWTFVLAFAAYSIVSFFPEALLLRVAGAALAERRAAAAPSEATLLLGKEEAAAATPGATDPGANTAAVPAATSFGGGPAAALCVRTVSPLLLYARQPAAPVMLALALLYFTVLSFHGVMTAYLQAEGSSDLVISLFRGAGALFGLLSTAIFPFAAPRLSLPALAAGSVLFQLAFITLGAVPLVLGALPSRDSLLYVFQGGTAVSRLGLWLADLAITQLIQETSAAAELGAVQGTQRSVCAVFELLSYVATLVFAQPAQFPILMLGSLGAVALSAAICAHYAWAQRGKGGGAGGAWQLLEGVGESGEAAAAGEEAPLLRQ